LKAKATSGSTPAPPSETPGSTKSKAPPNKKRKVDMEEVLPSVKTSASETPPFTTKKHDKKERGNTKLAPAAAGGLEDDNIRGPPNIQDSVKIQTIVKSASNRAKTARSRALSMSKNASHPTKSAVA
jgi:hypothetical protein